MPLDTPPFSVTFEKKKLVVVFGMHRSGTSALSRGLIALGINLGNNLMPPLQGNNDRGFWEDLGINSLSNDLLDAVGSRWDDVSDIAHKLRNNPNLAEFKIRACQLLQTHLTGRPNFGFKDPRTCRLLPFWQEVFEILDNDVYYVISSRNPISIAQSLRKRDSFPEEKSYLLWLTHMLAALHQTAGSHRVVIDYDHLMDNPRQELLRIAEFLDIKINKGIERKIAIYEDKFLTDTLRHTHFDADALKFESRAPRIVRCFFGLCCKLAAGVEDVNSKNTIDKIDKFYHQSTDWASAIGFAGSLDFEVSNMTQKNQQLSALAVERDRRVVELAHEVDSLKAQELQAAERIECLNQAIGERDRRAVELTREVDSLKAQELQAAERIESLNQAIGERDRRAVELTREVDSLKAQELQAAERIESLNQAIGERDRRAVELTREVDSLKAWALQAAERDVQIVSLNQVMTERDRQIDSLNHAVNQALAERDTQFREREAEMGLIMSSRSWKVTRPFRFVGRVLRGARAAVRAALSPLRNSKGNSFVTKEETSEIKSVICIDETSKPLGNQTISFAPPFFCGNRILLVSYYCPSRAHAGGQRILDIYSLIKSAFPNVRIDLYTHKRPAIDWSYEDAEKIFDTIFLSPIEDLSFSGFNQLYKAATQYDVIDLQFHQSAYDIESWRKVGQKILFTPMESHVRGLLIALRCQDVFSVGKMQRHLLLAKEEMTFSRKADEVVCVSEKDASSLRMFCHATKSIFPGNRRF